MSEKTTAIDQLNLSGTNDGKITIAVIEEPYGPKSESVVSIGISLQADAAEPDWKVHLPKSNIDDVIAALQKAKETL
ncbi:MAG TPA: hypothetical protein ENK71_00350 [Epsilonproteobacteria bacterium]|nr:hypothetical protein [Campylobacterota bacterium]HHD73053.1 hypothetical protein [Campylobacterota bacterium]